jgi:crotonobetainyl-CoA:carnitine CoA-transferase CaiB-like acyl-CoA transferase
LELGNFISGPYAAVLLSDMGAEVIKVENPKGGDPFRGWDLGGDQPNLGVQSRQEKRHVESPNSRKRDLSAWSKSRRRHRELSAAL